MALPEETEIMAEIGLGQHYTWHNGSGGCHGTAVEAARRLPDALEAHGCELHPELLEMVGWAVDREDSIYVLTKTWVAASDVIQAHLHYRDSEDGAWWDRLKVSLAEHYPPPTPRVGPHGEVIW